jgi:hypothetical protein
MGELNSFTFIFLIMHIPQRKAIIIPLVVQILKSFFLILMVHKFGLVIIEIKLELR